MRKWVRSEKRDASLREKIKGPSEREWLLGRVCVCDNQATELETTRCSRGDIRSPGRTCASRSLGGRGVALWGWCVPRGWRRPSERCSILWGGSSERARPRPLRCASALKTLWESVRRWSTSPPSSAGAARARPAAPSTNTGVIRCGESSPNM
jgi:hypothetical protein